MGATFCHVQSSHCNGFSCCEIQDALEHGLNSCSVQAWLSLGLRDLPIPGTKLTSPALAGRFLTTGHQGNLLCVFFWGGGCSFKKFPPNLNFRESLVVGRGGGERSALLRVYLSGRE